MFCAPSRIFTYPTIYIFLLNSRLLFLSPVSNLFLSKVGEDGRAKTKTLEIVAWFLVLCACTTESTVFTMEDEKTLGY